MSVLTAIHLSRSGSYIRFGEGRPRARIAEDKGGRDFPRLGGLNLMRMKLLLKIVGGVVALIVVVLIGVNMLISADAVRDRVASRVKEQSGRDLKVNGSTSLLLLPNPHIVLTDVEITDPQGRPGGDLSIARLALDVSFRQLISRKVDANRVVMERPVLTLRLAAKAPLRATGRSRCAVARFRCGADEVHRG